MSKSGVSAGSFRSSTSSRLLVAMLLIGAPVIALSVGGCADDGLDGRAEEVMTDGIDHVDTTLQVADPTNPVDKKIPYAAPNGDPTRFAFASGRIEMEYQGMLNGTRRIYFDQWGLRERTFDSSWAADPPIPLIPPRSVAIMTEDRYAVVDLREGVARSGPNISLERLTAEWRSSTRPLGELALARSGGSRLADTTILGQYRCRVYRQEGNGMTRTIYVWGGIPLAEAVTFGGDRRTGYRVMPTDVELDIGIDDKLFTLPDNIAIKPFEE